MNFKNSTIFIVSFVFFCSPLLHNPVQANQENSIRVVSPVPSSEIIGKHPVIQVQFNVPVDRESLVILLDDTDITATAEITDKGFQCRTPMILPAGSHTLYIGGNDSEGYFEQEITFSSHQYTGIDEAYSSNEWSLNLQAGNSHFGNQDDYTSSSLDSTLNSETVLKKGNLQLSLTGNARLLEEDYNGRAHSVFEYGPEELDQQDEEQEQNNLDPEQQGLDINTVLLRTQYQSNSLTAAVELGDLQVDSSENTLSSLARNGGQVSLEYHNLYLGGFSVFGSDTFGVRDGLGIGFDADDHLYGTSGGIHLWEDAIDFKIFYIEGGQQENSYSSWSQEQGNQGSVYGAVLSTVFFDNALAMVFEYDKSDFDANTSDTFAGNSDEAYRLEVNGQTDIYTYGLRWEQFGLEYDVPGNLSPLKDYQGLSANGAVQFENQGVDLSLSGYHDNVESDPLYPRINSLDGQVGYHYDGFEAFPLSISYQHTRDQSGDEPTDSEKTEMDTDTISAGIGYAGTGILTINFNTDYSWQDDKAEQDQDNATLSLILSPSLTFDYFSINLSGALNQNRDFSTRTRSDDYTLTLDGMGTLFEDIVSYEFGGTYDHSLYTDDSGDQHSLTSYGRIAWHLPWLEDSVHPVVGLELEYSRNKQENSDTEEDTKIFCTLSTVVPFSF